MTIRLLFIQADKKNGGKMEKRHRDGVFYTNGSEFWYNNGIIHRDDGPAVIRPDGHQAWYQNGKRHREDGPAVTYSNGYQEWYFNGNNIDIHLRDMRYFFPFWCEVISASREDYDRRIRSFLREDLFSLTV